MLRRNRKNGHHIGNPDAGADGTDWREFRKDGKAASDRLFRGQFLVQRGFRGENESSDGRCWVPFSILTCEIMSEQAVRVAAQTQNTRRRWIMPLLIGLAGLVGLVVVLFLWVRMFGQVQGEEFSPHLFGRRFFVYYQVPVFGLQVTPIVRVKETKGIERFLVSQKFVARAALKELRWDLVIDNLHRRDSPECDAGILTAYLDARGSDGDLYWETWSSANQARAKVLWPAVAEAAREELYVLVPDLIDAAQRFEQPGELQTALSESLSSGYGRFAASVQRRGLHQRAIALFGLALKHDPQDTTALRGRAKSLSALGKQQQAAADLAEAQKLDGKRI
jgi:tetratricopeptide (TPR) repeat protein